MVSTQFGTTTTTAPDDTTYDDVTTGESPKYYVDDGRYLVVSEGGSYDEAVGRCGVHDIASFHDLHHLQGIRDQLTTGQLTNCYLIGLKVDEAGQGRWRDGTVYNHTVHDQLYGNSSSEHFALRRPPDDDVSGVDCVAPVYCPLIDSTLNMPCAWRGASFLCDVTTHQQRRSDFPPAAPADDDEVIKIQGRCETGLLLTAGLPVFLILLTVIGLLLVRIFHVSRRRKVTVTSSSTVTEVGVYAARRNDVIMEVTSPVVDTREEDTYIELQRGDEEIYQNFKFH